jgi:chromosome segregation ATPase
MELQEMIEALDRRIRRLEEGHTLQDDRMTSIEQTLDTITTRFKEWQGRIETTLIGFTDTTARLMSTTQDQNTHYLRVIKAVEHSNQLLTTHTEVTNTWAGVIKAIQSQVASNTISVGDVHEKLKTLTDYVGSTDERVGLFASKVNNLETDVIEDKGHITHIEDKLGTMGNDLVRLDESVKVLIAGVNRVLDLITPRNIIALFASIALFIGVDTGRVQQFITTIEKFLGG